MEKLTRELIDAAVRRAIATRAHVARRIGNGGGAIRTGGSTIRRIGNGGAIRTGGGRG